MAEFMEYRHMMPETALPEIVALPPFRAVVIVEATASPEWRSLASNWLVRSGCLYLMAWGLDCSSWHDAVDITNCEQFDYGEIPDDRFVMTTWHAEKPLEEVFRFAKSIATHPTVAIEHTMLLHVSMNSREHELLRAYADA